MRIQVGGLQRDVYKSLGLGSRKISEESTGRIKVLSFLTKEGPDKGEDWTGLTYLGSSVLLQSWRKGPIRPRRSPVSQVEGIRPTIYDIRTSFLRTS